MWYSSTISYGTTSQPNWEELSLPVPAPAFLHDDVIDIAIQRRSCAFIWEEKQEGVTQMREKHAQGSICAHRVVATFANDCF